MKPKKFLSTIVAGVLSIFFATTVIVNPSKVAKAAEDSTIAFGATSVGLYERSSNVYFWVGDVLRAADEPITVWSEPDLTGISHEVHGQEQITICRILGDNIYEVCVPKAHFPYYVKLSPDQVFCSSRSALKLATAKRIRFDGILGEHYDIFSSMDENAEVIGCLQKNQLIENFEVESFIYGWIRIGENQYVNLGSYNGLYFFESEEEIETTISTTTTITTTATTTTISTAPEITTTIPNISIPKYRINDIVAVKDSVNAYLSRDEADAGFVLNSYDGFKILDINNEWYIVKVWNINEVLYVKNSEENSELFSLVYRENNSITTTTTTTSTSTSTSTTTTTTSTSTTTTSTTTTAATTSETSTATTTSIVTQDIPVFEPYSTLKFVGAEYWGEREQMNLDGEPPKKFTPDNPYISLGAYLGNGWYEVFESGTYVCILEKDSYLFTDVTASFTPGTDILFLGKEWNVRSDDAWGNNVISSYGWLTEVTVLKSKKNWHYVVDNNDECGWIFVDPTVWMEYDEGKEENSTEPPIEVPTENPSEEPSDYLFNSGDVVKVTSWDPWKLRNGQNWADEAILGSVPKGDSITIIQPLNDRWFVVKYNEILYFINIPIGQEEWFEKVNI